MLNAKVLKLLCSNLDVGATAAAGGRTLQDIHEKQALSQIHESPARTQIPINGLLHVKGLLPSEHAQYIRELKHLRHRLSDNHSENQRDTQSCSDARSATSAEWNAEAGGWNRYNRIHFGDHDHAKNFDLSIVTGLSPKRNASWATQWAEDRLLLEGEEELRGQREEQQVSSQDQMPAIMPDPGLKLVRVMERFLGCRSWIV